VCDIHTCCGSACCGTLSDEPAAMVLTAASNPMRLHCALTADCRQLCVSAAATVLAVCAVALALLCTEPACCPGSASAVQLLELAVRSNLYERAPSLDASQSCKLDLVAKVQTCPASLQLILTDMPSMYACIWAPSRLLCCSSSHCNEHQAVETNVQTPTSTPRHNYT
jgi:hypothetical protein